MGTFGPVSTIWGGLLRRYQTYPPSFLKHLPFLSWESRLLPDYSRKGTTAVMMRGEIFGPRRPLKLSSKGTSLGHGSRGAGKWEWQQQGGAWLCPVEKRTMLRQAAIFAAVASVSECFKLLRMFQPMALAALSNNNFPYLQYCVGACGVCVVSFGRY
ncbi:hypothetical protein N658DRAFT_236369 [Parathielavia hyrcaniae]|uniref:Uncharacterized protein n=1 Tax=Parathielavia hyrcaniae TaxID=113614 RepID=A0AAN6Q5I8_9PEZI|nr:hypothetical protein N658DRAFT_236369 [Parathielavia hyrcaniae]